MAKRTYDPFAPTRPDVELAKESIAVLAPHTTSRQELRLRIVEEGEACTELALPSVAVRFLAAALNELAHGNAITLIPLHAELTTQQAADLLNVSRPYLVKLLDEGEIAHRRVGTRRRVRLRDLMQYKAHVDDARHDTLDQLTREAEDLDLGY